MNYIEIEATTTSGSRVSINVNKISSYIQHNKSVVVYVDGQRYELTTSYEVFRELLHKAYNS